MIALITVARYISCNNYFVENGRSILFSPSQNIMKKSIEIALRFLIKTEELANNKQIDLFLFELSGLPDKSDKIEDILNRYKFDGRCRRIFTETNDFLSSLNFCTSSRAVSATIQFFNRLTPEREKTRLKKNYDLPSEKHFQIPMDSYPDKSKKVVCSALLKDGLFVVGFNTNAVELWKKENNSYSRMQLLHEPVPQLPGAPLAGYIYRAIYGPPPEVIPPRPTCVAQSLSNDSLLVIGQENGFISVVQTPNNGVPGKENGLFQAHEGAVSYVGFSQENLLISASDDKLVKIWAVDDDNSFKLSKTLNQRSFIKGVAQWTHNGTAYLATACQEGLEIWFKKLDYYESYFFPMKDPASCIAAIAQKDRIQIVMGLPNGDLKICTLYPDSMSFQERQNLKCEFSINTVQLWDQGGFSHILVSGKEKHCTLTQGFDGQYFVNTTLNNPGPITISPEGDLCSLVLTPDIAGNLTYSVNEWNFTNLENSLKPAYDPKSLCKEIQDKIVKTNWNLAFRERVIVPLGNEKKKVGEVYINNTMHQVLLEFGKTFTQLQESKTENKQEIDSAYCAALIRVRNIFAATKSESVSPQINSFYKECHEKINCYLGVIDFVAAANPPVQFTV